MDTSTTYALDGIDYQGDIYPRSMVICGGSRIRPRGRAASAALRAAVLATGARIRRGWTLAIALEDPTRIETVSRDGYYGLIATIDVTLPAAGGTD